MAHWRGQASVLLSLCLCLSLITAEEAPVVNVRDLIPVGQESGPVVLYHETSGSRLQSDGTKSRMVYGQPEEKVAPGVDSDSVLIFTSDGFIKHRATGKCFGPETEAVRDAVVALVQCQGPQALWSVTDAGSLKHTQSGLCLHPNGGSSAPAANTLAIFHSPCDEPRLNFIPARPTDPPPVVYTPEAVDAQLNPGGARRNDLHKSPACCYSEQCLVPRTRRHAFLTPVRTAEYVTPARNLACSLAKTNPNSHLIILGAEGDNLTAADIASLRSASTPDLSVEYLVVPDLTFPSYTNVRFHRNWIKLVAFNLTDYDAIVMLDSDITVIGDLKHLFHLPTHFAWSPLQGLNYPYNGGGFYFLRPCKAVFEHMVTLLRRNRVLQFRNIWAEQSFLGWYFGHEGFRLSWIYNANAHQHADLPTLGTATGLRPIVLHFADQKPWDLPKDSPLQKYANGCSREFPGRPPLARFVHTRKRSTAAEAQKDDPSRLVASGKQAQKTNSVPGGEP